RSRRHTMCYRYWSSDVCFSDLAQVQHGPIETGLQRRGDVSMHRCDFLRRIPRREQALRQVRPRRQIALALLRRAIHAQEGDANEIGRASCRERAEGDAVDVDWK